MMSLSFHSDHLDGVRFGFICCPNCLSLVRVDRAVLTVDAYQMPAQAIRFTCPACDRFCLNPDVHLIHQNAIDALCRYAPKLSDLIADEAKAKENHDD